MKSQMKQQIAQSLAKYMHAHGMSQNEFAKQTGVNVAYLSAINNGDDKVGETPIANKWYEIIAEKIGVKLEKSYWEPVVTEQLKRTLATLEDAKEYGYTNVITGETGCGKSFACKLFASQYPIDTFIITVSQSDTIGDLIDKVLDTLKLPSAKSKSKRLNDITKHMRNLKHQGLKPMLMFDEAEYMKQPALCAMKEFYDNLQNVCSIIMIGTDQLIRNLDKMRRKNKDGIPQLYRRIKFGIRVLPMIDKTFKEFLNTIEDKGLRKFLCANCNNYGELHDVLVPALREADRTNQSLTEDFVRTILNMPNL